MRRRGRARRREPEEFPSRLDAALHPDPPPKRRPRKPKRQRRGRRSPVAPLLLLALLLFGLFYGIYQLGSAVFGEEEAPITVAVEKGDTLSSVADKLEEAGVISSSTLFKLEARVKGAGAEMKAGEYELMSGEDVDEILETLSSGDSVSTFEVAIPEGLTLSQTAEVIEESTGIPAEEFEAAAEETGYGYAFLDDPAVETTEGFLFPKTYEFEKGVEADQIVDRLLEQYLIETRELDFAGAQKRFNLTEYELVTTASLIEREAATPEERPLIASVIYNRIRQKMPLQVDATIQYALGEPKEKLSLDDLETESPYNTYKYSGLPPGPIASPSRGAIEAALDPAQTDYLYYVLEEDGEEHFFTNDYDEFLEAKEEAGR